MGITTFILMNSIIITGAYLLTYKILKIKDFIDSLLCLFTLYFSQIIISEIILGILGRLYLKNLILLNLIVLIIIYIFARNNASVFNGTSILTNFKDIIQNKVVLFCICVVITFSLVKVFVNLVNPPFGWDSLNYHFTFPVEWLKQGNLNTPITIFDDPSPTYYPINGSLFYLWLMLPFKSVFLADLGQLPFFILAVLAVYGIARKTGLNKEWSFYSAALFALIPNFFKQLQIAYVDIMVAAFFLVCLNYLFLLNKNFSWRNVLIYSLSLGLLIGTKTVALPFSVLLIIPFIIIFLKNTSKFNLVLLLILCVFILGGYSYLNNIFETGNPLYPLDFKIFNTHIFKGVLDRGEYSSHFKASDYGLGNALFHEGLGAQALLIILPGIFLALIVALLKRRKALDFNLVYFLVLPILIYLAYRYAVPLANLRYLYALMGIGMVLGFYVFDALHIKRRWINIIVAICVIASMSELAKRQELVSSVVLSTLLFFVVVLLKKIRISLNRYALITIFAVIFGILIWSEKYYQLHEYPGYYKMRKYSGFWPDATIAWDWLNSNTDGNNIAYLGRPVPFPLYGLRFKNNVYYVSVNKTDPAKLHYFKNSSYHWGGGYEDWHKNLEADGNYRFGANYETWLDNLEKRRTDYLFIYSLQRTKEIAFPLEDAWVTEHPDKFKNVFSNSMVHIYKILK